MLDLAYVLLVIFILMCTASVQGVKVNLPKASKAPSLAKPKIMAITVNNKNEYFLNTTPDDRPAGTGAETRGGAGAEPDHVGGHQWATRLRNTRGSWTSWTSSGG